MEEFFENSNYKSGWKPLVKDDGINAIKTRTISEKPNTNIENVTIPADTSNKPEQKNNAKKASASDVSNNAETNLKTPEISKAEGIDILKEMSKLSTDIQSLNNMLLEQNEKIDNLLNLLEKKDASGKKTVFGLSWK